MKIISVRLLNLNSLVGENTIDFTSPQFEESGIFAIVGPTGSGKTTILDAICLALYGRTPRLEKINKSSNEIMSKTTGECFAEVVFETVHGGKSERFRCRWSQNRALDSPTGLLQQAKHVLSNADTGEILEEKSKVPGAVEEKTGMNFKQFTRSMMLAQGEFTRFLNSNESERGDILEKITGMQIYSDISIKVFERNREEKAKLALFDQQLQGMTLMDEQEETELKNTLAEREKQDAEIRARLQLLQTAVAHWNKLDKLRQENATLEMQWREHERQIAAFVPSAERLALAERAETVEAAWNLYDNVQKQWDNLKSGLKESKERLPKVNAGFDRTREQETNASEALKMARKRQEDEKPILREVMKLDEAIRLLDEEIVKIDHRILQGEKDVKKHGTAVTNAENELAKLFPGDSFSETEKKAEQLLEQTDRLLDGKTTAELLDERQSLSSRQSLLEKLVLDMKSRDELATDERRWTDQRTEAKKSFDELQGRIEKLTRTQDELADRCVEIQKRLDQRRRILDFEEARKHLEDEHECPLCGALEHPFARGNVPVPDEIEQELAEAKKNRDEVRAETERLRIDLTKQKSLEDQARKMQDENEKKKQFVHDVLQRHLAEMKLDEIPPLETVRIDLAENQKAGEELTKKIDSIVDLQDQIEKRNKKLALGRVGKSNIETETALLEQARQTLESRLAEKTALAEKRSEKAGHRIGLYGESLPTEVENRLAEDVAKAEKTFETAQKNRSEAETLLARTQEQINTLKIALDEAETNFTAAETAYRQRLAEKEFETESEFLSARLESTTREELESQKTNFALRRRELETLRTKNAEDLEAELSSVDAETEPVYKLSQDELAEEIAAGELRQQELGTETVRLRVKLEGDAEARKNHRALAAQRAEQNRVCRLWDEMNRLIGSSTGVKFKVFAQGLTFRIMIEHANVQLQKMTDRYILVQGESNKNPLELAVVDTYQADMIRSMQNLSGGESFLVSLALALGLASMSGKRTRVDSLFLDEGFGTLDEKTLDTALAALEELRAEGKQIGIISHVQAVKDRIPVQIQLKRVSKGRNKVHVVPELK